MPETKYGSINFQEKIDFFKNKLRLPTATWSDIWQQQHAKAFVVAGAMKDELLADFQQAIAKGISGESTLEDFRKDFDSIVKKHGWSYNGGRNWRTRIIYDTNLRTAYSAGRYQQMQQVKRSRPYWQYKHSIASENARQNHLSWDGMVLRADDPWWDIHYPPNGWGCQCYVRTLSARDIERKGLSVAKAPKTIWKEKTIGIRTNPRTVKVADGVDAGFAYNPGKAAWGEQLSQKAFDDFKVGGEKVWQPMITTNYADLGRPRKIPLDLPSYKLAARNLSPQAMEKELTTLIGTEKVFEVHGLPVLVNSQALAGHIATDRSEYLPLIVEALEDPYEVWLNFDLHQVTGKVALRGRVVKAFDIGSGKVILVTAQVNKGILEAWTVIPISSKKTSYIDKQRIGKLIYGKE